MKKQKGKIMKNFDWISEVIRGLMQNKYTGYIRINFSRGGISNINKEESLIPPKEDSKK